MSFVDMLTSEMLTILVGLGGLGIFGTLLTYLFNTITKYRQNNRERIGLIRILYHEMDGNRSVLCNQVCQSSEKILAEKLRSGTYDLHLATDGWEATRVRLAQLLCEDEFTAICDYYMSLRALKD